MPLMNDARLILIGLALNFYAVATSAEVVAVVSAKSSIIALSKNQIVDIFLGTASRFPNGELASPIDQIESSIARKEFYEKFAGQTSAQWKAHWSKLIFTGRGRPPPVAASATELKQILHENIRAIGYVNDNELDESVRVLRAN